MAAKYLSREDAAKLLLFGSGPQGRGHLDAMRSIRTIANVTIVANTQLKAEALSRYAASVGHNTRVLRIGDPANINGEVAKADIIVCATTNSTSIFSGRCVSGGAHVCEPNGVIDNSRPSLFKSSGMAWEDLAVAERAFRQGP